MALAEQIPLEEPLQKFWAFTNLGDIQEIEAVSIDEAYALAWERFKNGYGVTRVSVREKDPLESQSAWCEKTACSTGR